MVGRQIIASGAPRAESLAAMMTVATAAFPAASLQPFSAAAPTTTQPIDMEAFARKAAALTEQDKKELVASVNLLLQAADPAARSNAYLAWTSAGVNLASLHSFMEVVKLLGNSETCNKFALDSTTASALSKKMNQVSARAFIEATEQFPLNTLQMLHCTSPVFQKSWSDLIKMVGNTDAKAVKTAPAGMVVRQEEADWMNNAVEIQMTKYISLMEQEVSSMSAKQSSIFGAATGVTRKHPLLLSTEEFRQYIGKGAILSILDETKKAEIFNTWKVICDMIRYSNQIAVVDAVASVPAAAVWKSVAPSNNSLIDAMAKQHQQKTAVKHGLVTANYLAKQSILTANSRVKHVEAFLNEIISTDDLPTATPHFNLMTRLTAFQQDPATPFAKLGKNEVIAEKLLSDTDEGCLRTLFPQMAGAELGNMVNKPMKIMTAKLNEKSERVIVNGRIQLVPLDSVDKSLKQLVKQYVFGRAMIAAGELGGSKSGEGSANSAVSGETRNLFTA